MVDLPLPPSSPSTTSSRSSSSSCAESNPLDNDCTATATTTTTSNNNNNTTNPNEERIYSRQDLEVFNLLDQPVWIFDIVKRAMWFANTAAVELWSAPDLEALLARDFSNDMSDATANRLDDYLLKFSNSQQVRMKEQWTFYPNGLGPKTVCLSSRGICIEEGRLAMMCQGVYKETTSEAEQEALRSVEMLRHLPVAVCITDLDGNVMEQNPEALAVFGSVDKNKNNQQQTQKQKESDNHDDDDDYDDDDDDDDDGDTRTGANSTFIKRFVDKELGHRILEQAKAGKEVISLEALQHTVHGPRWSAVQVRQTKDPVTSEPILLYSARDITAVVEAKRQAVAADVAKMDLLTDMAHAIRTPLQHVVGVVELISRQSNHQDDSSNPTKPHDNNLITHIFPQETQLSTLLQSAAQLLMTVIHDLMESVGSAGSNKINTNGNLHCNTNRTRTMGMGVDRPPSAIRYNRLDGSNHELDDSSCNKRNNRILLEHSQFDVRHVLENIVATIAPQAKVKNLSFQVHTHKFSRNSTAYLVMGDANRLGQVLFEILHNALKYTSKGGIAVTVRKTQSQSRRVRMRFSVRDSGVGLNLEQQRQCMTPRNDSNGTANEGVGLLLCKSILEAMGGTIGVDSKPGRGTNFWFEIPFLRAAVPVPSVSPKSHREECSSTDFRNPPRKSRKQCSKLDPVFDEGKEGGLQILLVDEDNVGRNITVALLEQSGHSVTTANNSGAMVSAVSQDSYDVVLLEVRLSPQSGNKRTVFEAVREIRNMGYSPEALPILALTAAVPRADYPELGLNDWLTKPIFIKKVETAMTNAICNVGARSVGTGSVFDVESHCSSMNDSGASLGICNNSDNTPTLPRRGSFGSIRSAFSDHLQAIMGSSGMCSNTCPTRVSTTCSNTEDDTGISACSLMV